MQFMIFAKQNFVDLKDQEDPIKNGMDFVIQDFRANQLKTEMTVSYAENEIILDGDSMGLFKLEPETRRFLTQDSVQKQFHLVKEPKLILKDYTLFDLSVQLQMSVDKLT